MTRRGTPATPAPASRLLTAPVLTTLALVTLVLAGLVGPVAPVAAAPAQSGGDADVTVGLDAMTPRVVTGDGPPELVVTGRVVHRGGEAVRDVTVAARRGAALTSDRAADDALAGASPTDEVVPGATPVADELAPGGEAAFTLRLPLRGPAGSSLALTAPGVYPLLLDVEGTSAGTAPARLAAVRLLLPVTGLPGGPTAPVPPPALATAVSVLYPIADRPRRLPVVPGAPTLLSDDDLATSFAPGGRLAGLVDALGGSAPLGTPAASAVCLAVDADLLETAQAMAAGYQVATPAGPRPGTGDAAAGAWLGAVRAAAQGRCVLALPYANADLPAISRGNMGDLASIARTLGARRTAELLGVPVVPDATAPPGGLLDERSLADLAGGGARALVVTGDGLVDGVPPGGVGRFAGDGGTAASPLAAATDPLGGRALASRPPVDGAVVATGALAGQDALGIAVLRALDAPTRPAPGGLPPAATVLFPPTDWSTTGAGAGALLEGIGDLARRGLIAPVDVGTLLTTAGRGGTTVPAVTLDPREDLPAEPSAAVLDGLRAVRDDQRALLAAIRPDRTGSLTPAEYVEPLTGALLRSLTAGPDDDRRRAAADAVAAQTRSLLSMVRVVQPAGAYSLGSDDAPLLLTVENQLPVAVDVTVAIEPTPGVRVSPVPVRRVPAFGSFQFQVALDVERSGQFTVDATARTPGGETLGPTSRLLLRSTAYGTITVWLTASAALVLVILASLRVARRVREGRHDRRSRRRRHGDPPTPASGTPTSGTTDGPTTGPGRALQSR